VYFPQQERADNKYGFVEMATETEAIDAIDALDGAEWMGYDIQVKLAE